MYSSSLSGEPRCGLVGPGAVAGQRGRARAGDGRGGPRGSGSATSTRLNMSDGAAGLLSGGKEDRPVAARAVVGAEGDVSAQNGASLAEEILEVLPAHAVGELVAGVSSAPSRLWRTARTHVSDEELGCVCRAGDGGRRGPRAAVACWMTALDGIVCGRRGAVARGRGRDASVHIRAGREQQICSQPLNSASGSISLHPQPAFPVAL